MDAQAPPDGYLLNCAHPDHLERALDASTASRLTGIRPNASRRSHAELDESTELDEGDLLDLARRTAELCERLSALRTVGRCCGTDVRHVEAIWDRIVGVGI